MAGMLRKGMSWLGLGPDEDYDDDDYYVDDEYLGDEPLEPEPRPTRRRRVETHDLDDDVAEPGGIRVIPTSETRPPRVESSTGVRPLPDQRGADDAEPAPRTVVRPLPASAASPHRVKPQAFNDAQEVGDWFKRRQPVVLDLQGLERDLARRLLDFASGVAYGLGGRVERVASHVYLLTPAEVEVSAEERRRMAEGVLVDD